MLFIKYYNKDGLENNLLNFFKVVLSNLIYGNFKDYIRRNNYGVLVNINGVFE